MTEQELTVELQRWRSYRTTAAEANDIIKALLAERDALKAQLETANERLRALGKVEPLSDVGCDGSEHCACQACSVTRTMESMRHDG